jgi:hypothetical protein
MKRTIRKSALARSLVPSVGAVHGKVANPKTANLRRGSQAVTSVSVDSVSFLDDSDSDDRRKSLVDSDSDDRRKSLVYSESTSFASVSLDESSDDRRKLRRSFRGLFGLLRRK